MITSRLAHTLGPVCIETPMDEYWIVKANQQAYEWYPLVTVDNAPDKDSGISMKEARANAELVMEAFNVATETGMTPRQLHEVIKSAVDTNLNLQVQCSDLRMALTNIAENGTGASKIHARAALDKATGAA